jgi:hypothetical protein
MSEKLTQKIKVQVEKFTASVVEDLRLSEDEVRDILSHMASHARSLLFSSRPSPSTPKEEPAASEFEGLHIPELDDLQDGNLTRPKVSKKKENNAKESAKPAPPAKRSEPVSKDFFIRSAVKATKPAAKAGIKPSVPGRAKPTGTGTAKPAGNTITKKAVVKEAQQQSKTVPTTKPSTTKAIAVEVKQGTNKQVAPGVIKSVKSKNK